MTYDADALKNATNTDDEVSARWVADHHDAVRLIDVREPHELTGPLGAVDGVENIPLVQLVGRASTLEPSEPLVLICRSGRRSSEAVDALKRAGFEAVASVEGGMLAYDTVVLGKDGILAEEKTANTSNLDEAVYNHNGVAEVSATWVAENVGRFRLVDVREPHELDRTGKVPQAEHIPLQTFLAQAQAFDREAPLVVMCASGGRSGRAVAMLQGAGFKSVASLEGGMFGWQAYGLPIIRVAA